MNSEYRTAAQDSKDIKKALRAKWPNVKWSVRAENFAGGSAVRVSWVDGPTEAQVNVIAKAAEHISRDASGEILGGGNRFVHHQREVTDRVKRYAALRVSIFDDLVKYEREQRERQVRHYTEVRADGQLIEWDRFAKFERPAPHLGVVA